MKDNQNLKNIQVQRAKIIDLIREFFKKAGFLEVETPILVPYAGTEPYLDPIKINFRDDKGTNYSGYLITSPEYSLKKLLALGFDKIFEITKAFRQKEAFGGYHNIEFSLLEWYRLNSNYRQIMKDVENLIYFLAKKINKKSSVSYLGQKIDLTPPWRMISVKEAFKIYSQIDLEKVKKFNDFKKILISKNYSLNKENTWDDLFFLIFLNEIEPCLPKNQPVIIYDYPLPQAALAKKKNPKSFYAERFEVYIGGLEIANAFSELTDYKEQEKRLKQEQKLRKKLKKEIIPIDKEFIFALKSGIPASAGIALGIDRLQMLLLDIEDINDLLIFPAKKIFN